jgi:hypothetical protein
MVTFFVFFNAKLMKLISVLRKGLASVTLAAIALMVVPMANAASVSSFTDANQIPSWADEAIEELMDQGVINGNADGSFAPSRQLNRAEVSKIIVLATGVDMDTSGGNAFPDVTAGDWFYDYVMTMYNYGWVNGYPDGYFRPAVGINRVEIAKMVVEAFELDTDTTGGPHFSDVSEDSWMYGYVETVFNNGLMTGFASGKFGAETAVTRAETARIVYDGQLAVIGTTTPTEGTLEVVLSYDTPRGTNIPYNATSVPFTTVEMTAADDSDVEISSITVTRLGLGDNDDFDNVWLEIDGFKVGNERAINNDDYAELRFNPPVVVPAGQTLVADVVASLEGNSTSVGQHNRLAVVSASDVVSTAVNVVGDFPIEGEEMEIADYQVSQAEFDSLGSDTTVNVGDAFVEIGKFKLLNATTTNKDIEFRAITFKNDGTAQLADVLENVVLYVSGEQVSAETIIDGDYVTFRLDNGVTGGYVVEDGDSRIFSIRADIVSAEDGDVINFKVDNFEDIVGVEIGTAFGVKAISGETNTLTFSDSSTSTGTATCTDGDAEDNCARLKAYVIDSGDINISRDPASLGNQEYAPGSNDVVFMTARLVVDQPLTIDGMKVKVGTGTSVLATTNPATTADTVAAFEAQFDNFRLYLNDQLVDSKNELTESTTLVGSYFDFDTQFEIAGTSILKLVGNIKDGATTGSQVKFSVTANADLDSPEYISTGDQVATDQLLGSAESSFVEVQQSNLTITKTDGFSIGDKVTFDGTETFVAGADDLTVFKFVLDNNDAGDVNVTSITVNAYGTGNATTYTNFQTAIFVDGVQQGSSRNFDGTTLGTATFNDLSVNIPSAGQKEFTVVLDTIESSAASAAASTVVAGAGTTATEAYTDDTTLNGATVPGDTTVTVTDASNYAVGDTLIIFTDTVADGTYVEADDTLLERIAVKAITGNIITIGNTADPTQQDSLGVGHADGTAVEKVTYVYDTTDIVKVSDVSGFTVGDTVDIDGTSFVIESIDTANSELDLDANLTAIAVGEAVTQTNTDSTIQFKVSAVDVDNVENGQSVEVTNLATSNDNCTANIIATSTVGLCSAIFDIVSSGTLNANIKRIENLDSQILVGGQNDVTVMQIEFNATNDDVEISDLYFDNVAATDDLISERLAFTLYDQAGAVVQTAIMNTEGKLVFELGNNRVIVPEDDYTILTVKVNVGTINRTGHTGKELQLQLNTVDYPLTNGIVAYTTATGANIDTGANDPTNGTAIVGDSFVAYKTKVEFANATTQPSLQDGGRLFYFTATADSAGNATVDKLTLNITSTAGVLAGTGNIVLAACEDASLVRHDTAAFNDASPTLVTVGEVAANSSECEFYFDANEQISAGQTAYFELKTTEAVTDSGNDGEKVYVKFVSDAGLLTTETDRNTAVASARKIVWSDRSNSGAFGPYLNGYELTVPANSDGASD